MTNINGDDISDVASFGTKTPPGTSSDGRQQWSTGPVTITVGSDADSLQEAVDMIPFMPYHLVKIDVPSGTDLSNEDVLIPQIHARHDAANDNDTEHAVEITGDTDNPSNNPLGSLTISGMMGGFCEVVGFEFQHDNPYGGNSAPVLIEYCNAANIGECSFAGGTNGVVVYGRSHAECRNIDFGENVLSGSAIMVKHGAHVQMQNVGECTGTVGEYAYRAQVGVVDTVEDDTLTGSQGQVDPDLLSGMVREAVRNGRTITKFVGPEYGFQALTINETISKATLSSRQTIAPDSTDGKQQIEFDTLQNDEIGSLTDNEIVVPSNTRYMVTGGATFEENSNWATGDRVTLQIYREYGQSSEIALASPLTPKVGTDKQTFNTRISGVFTSGEEVRLSAVVTQQSGSDQTITTPDGQTYLEVVRLG